MLRIFLKNAAYVSLVLLIGQIPVHQMTLGQVFLRQIQKALSWSSGEISKNKLVASLGKELRDISTADSTPAKAPAPAREHQEDPSQPDPEGMSPADKEALRRLLE